MKKLILIGAAGTLFFVSCVKSSSEYKQLLAEKDSLAAVSAQANADIEQFLALLNEVQTNFQDIKEKEHYLSVQSTAAGELTPTTREQVQNDLKFITETLNKNREKIADLEARLKKSNNQSEQLRQTLAALRTELEEKTATVVSLQEELAKKDRKIAEMSDNINALAADVKNLSQQTAENQALIAEQQAAINAVYYRFGTSKELKDAKIVVSGKLGSDFDPKYFIKEDGTKLKVVPLYAKKGTLVSKHPEGSYEFGKDANGKAELRILDAKKFWSLTKYLVVEVKM
ncbi:MAG: hypothetical protein LBR66_04795 [Candidatus Symbiothrix sp.]|jgi:predicted  nucleic acid-binding Zn-ribbon protein|nr:hypothetical protein [Candidatus Symbiothrix sp.]